MEIRLKEIGDVERISTKNDILSVFIKISKIIITIQPLNYYK